MPASLRLLPVAGLCSTRSARWPGGRDQRRMTATMGSHLHVLPGGRDGGHVKEIEKVKSFRGVAMSIPRKSEIYIGLFGTRKGLAFNLGGGYTPPLCNSC